MARRPRLLVCGLAFSPCESCGLGTTYLLRALQWSRSWPIDAYLYNLPLSAASLSSFSRPLPFPPPASSCCGLVLRPAAFSLSFFQIVAASWHWPPSVLAEHPQGLLGLQSFLTLRHVQARYPLAARCLSSARVVAVVYWSDCRAHCKNYKISCSHCHSPSAAQDLFRRPLDEAALSWQIG